MWKCRGVLHTSGELSEGVCNTPLQEPDMLFSRLFICFLSDTQHNNTPEAYNTSYLCDKFTVFYLSSTRISNIIKTLFEHIVF